MEEYVKIDKVYSLTENIVALGMSFSEIEIYVNNLSITISDEEITKFLKCKKREMILNCKTKEAKEEVSNLFIYTPDLLIHYKELFKRYKAHAVSLFQIIHVLDSKNKHNLLELPYYIEKYDIKLNDDLLIRDSDLRRIILALSINIKEMIDLKNFAENGETYIDNHFSFAEKIEEGYTDDDCYPPYDLQPDRYGATFKGCLPLTDKQRNELFANYNKEVSLLKKLLKNDVNK